MRVTGQVISVEPYGGSFNDRESGEKVAYSGTKVGVFDGREVVNVKCKANKLVGLGNVSKGDDIDMLVDVIAEGGARGVYLTVTFAERLDGSAHLAAVSKTS